MTHALPFRVEHVSRNISLVRMTVKGDKWEQRFLLSADRHHDNPKADWGMERRHLREAMETRAGILDFGDLFCAMQGKYDKRSNKSNVRTEHQRGNYLDRLVDTAADFYSPFAPNWILLAQGNHETSIANKHETDLVDRLASDMRRRVKGSPIHAGGMSGWVRFYFGRGETRHSLRLHYHHGYGGGGPVTKDIIQTNRKAVYLPNADIVVSGHTHDRWVFEISRIQLNDANRVVHTVQTHIKLPTYKQAYDDGHGGWEIEKGHPPKPLGAYWLVFKWDHHTNSPSYDFLKAT